VKKEVKRLKLKTKVEGLMKPATFKKRLDSLYSFLKHLKSKGLYNYDFEFITEYKRRNLRKLPSNKETLTVEEVYTLLNYDFGHSRYDRIQYMFVFACLTGMRYSDLKNFDKKFLKETSDGLVYKIMAQKTQRSSGLSIEVPLCKAAEHILLKYDKNLKGLIYPNNQTANKILKEALRDTKLFEEYTENKEKKTGRYLQRWECISMHKGRDTFITNLIDVTPLNELMKYTGHSKLSTLQIYLDRKREVKHDFVKAVFDKYISKEK
jgi:integrase